MGITYDEVQKYLGNNQSVEDFFDSEAVIWVDWREYDEDIIEYVNNILDGQIQVTHQDNGKEYGQDVIISYKDKTMQISYKEVMDRDTTIKSINELLNPDYEIRWFLESLGSDTLAFLVFEKGEIDKLNQEFGEDMMLFNFLPINSNSKMFDLSFGEVEKYFELYEKNPKVTPDILFEMIELENDLNNLIHQKQEGKIDLKTYLTQKKEMEGLIKDTKERYGIEM